ncbi:uncharacterized protein [Drosophila virilis]|uniref:MADF domain-containing protein n=1 Tax=Drosophila virilis TaxID=7244 RepID=B4M1A0_DROVI|nr:uncharacterized protein LOC6629896 [Drosophila virilis]EDW67511.1 uncharacterized protein Dvir_GJ23041 [Drosophila virilis]
MNVSNLNDLRSYSRHWLTEFIEQYQEEECLWQPKHHDYSNHAARNKAYDKLVEKLKEVEPNPDRAMVVRKINSLRSAFRREFRKSSSKSDYETRLWYYDKLLFIADHKPKRHSNELAGKPKRELHINFDDEDSMDFEEESHHTPQSQHIETIVPNPNDEVEEVAATNNVVVSSQGATLSTISVTPADCVTLVKDETHQAHNEVAEAHQRLVAQATAAQSSLAAAAAGGHAVKVLEITSLDSNSQREIQQAVNSLEHHQQQLQHLHHQANGHGQPVPTIQIGRDHYQPLFGNAATTAYTTAAPATSHRHEDEYDAIGVNVASKLRSINHTQRIIAEKLISDVLFNAQLDNLTVNSSLTQ